MPPAMVTEASPDAHSWMISLRLLLQARFSVLYMSVEFLLEGDDALDLRVEAVGRMGKIAGARP